MDRGVHGLRPPRLRATAAHPRCVDLPPSGLRRTAALRDADHRHRPAGSAHHRLVRQRGRRRRCHRCLHGAVRPAERQAGRPHRPARRTAAGSPRARGVRIGADGTRTGGRTTLAAVPGRSADGCLRPSDRPDGAGPLGGAAGRGTRPEGLAPDVDRRRLRVGDRRVHLRHRTRPRHRPVHRGASGGRTDRGGRTDADGRPALRRAAPYPARGPRHHVRRLRTAHLRPVRTGRTRARGGVPRDRRRLRRHAGLADRVRRGDRASPARTACCTGSSRPATCWPGSPAVPSPGRAGRGAG